MAVVEKQKSDRKQVEDLIKDIQKRTRKIESERSAIKVNQDLILQISEEHPEWFEDTNTVQFDPYGLIRYVNKTSLKTPEDFDSKVFMKKFPALIKLTPTIKVKEFLAFIQDEKQKAKIDEFGIEQVVSKVFEVKPNK